jgi:hypothetical protein
LPYISSFCSFFTCSKPADLLNATGESAACRECTVRVRLQIFPRCLVCFVITGVIHTGIQGSRLPVPRSYSCLRASRFVVASPSRLSYCCNLHFDCHMQIQFRSARTAGGARAVARSCRTPTMPPASTTSATLARQMLLLPAPPQRRSHSVWACECYLCKGNCAKQVERRHRHTGAAHTHARRQRHAELGLLWKSRRVEA